MAFHFHLFGSWRREYHKAKEGTLFPGSILPKAAKTGSCFQVVYRNRYWECEKVKDGMLFLRTGGISLNVTLKQQRF